jgi:hypothetical protein
MEANVKAETGGRTGAFLSDNVEEGLRGRLLEGSYSRTIIGVAIAMVSGEDNFFESLRIYVLDCAWGIVPSPADGRDGERVNIPMPFTFMRAYKIAGISINR